MMTTAQHDNPTPVEILLSWTGEAGTEVLGQALAELSRPGVVVALDGPLGAGKTRLARAWAEALGVDPCAISSPTFVLIHEYDGVFPVNHADAYRLSDAEQFEALGACENISQGEALWLIEWADKVADCLPPHTWRIRIVTPDCPDFQNFSNVADGDAQPSEDDPQARKALCRFPDPLHAHALRQRLPGFVTSDIRFDATTFRH